MQLKLGIIGLPRSGKSTIFRALTGGIEVTGRKGHQEPGLGVVKVQDSRLELLADHFKPKKVTPVHVEYADIQGFTGQGRPGGSLGDKFLGYIRPLDALVHCVRFFESASHDPSAPLKEFRSVEEEMILTDLAVIEKRMERIRKDLQKGKKELSEEFDLLTEAASLLDQGKPLRLLPQDDAWDKLSGFAFLSSKHELVLLNTGEDKKPDEALRVLEEIEEYLAGQPHMALEWLYADSEAEIARLSPADAAEFLREMSLDQGAKDRIIKTSFGLLDQIVFFTAGEPEVRTWQLKQGSTSLKAAGTVHSDMEKGFIRAEVLAFDDFREAGSMAAAHKVGKVRLEGRDYKVKDGDIILFRFNV
jgi:ribosome-binding ATPase